jgi:transposase
LTPIQHFSGGKTKLGSIVKYVKNSILRSQLVVGSMAAIRMIIKKDAKTKKERWIQVLVERRGIRCAAVALANKMYAQPMRCLLKAQNIKQNYYLY